MLFITAGYSKYAYEFRYAPLIIFGNAHPVLMCFLLSRMTALWADFEISGVWLIAFGAIDLPTHIAV